MLLLICAALKERGASVGRGVMDRAKAMQPAGIVLHYVFALVSLLSQGGEWGALQTVF